MPAAEEFELCGVKGLHAEREPVNPAAGQNSQHLDADLPGIALDREFLRIGPDRCDGFDEPGQPAHRQAGRAAAADVDRTHRRNASVFLYLSHES